MLVEAAAAVVVVAVAVVAVAGLAAVGQLLELQHLLVDRRSTNGAASTPTTYRRHLVHST